MKMAKALCEPVKFMKKQQLSEKTVSCDARHKNQVFENRGVILRVNRLCWKAKKHGKMKV
jgi:hypothetical protein